MPDEKVILVALFELGLLLGSCYALAIVVRKLARNEQLIPFQPRDESDAGGVFRWIRWAVITSRHNEGDPPDPTISPPASHFWSDVRLGLFGFLVAFLPVMCVHVYFQQVVDYQHPLIEAFRKNPTLTAFLQLSYMTVILGPLLEEFVFRNLLQGLTEVLERNVVRRIGGAEKYVFGVVPIVISSTVFALAHWGHGAAPVPLFLFSLILGYMYFQTHRLLPSIVAHVALNGSTMVQLWFLA